MKNMKVSMKLIVSFMIVIVLTVSIGVLGIYGMNNINVAKQDMYYSVAAPIPYLGKVEENLQSARVYVREMTMFAMADNQDGVDDSWRNVNRKLDDANSAIRSFREYTASDDVLRMFNESVRLFENDLVNTFNAIHTAARSGTPEDIDRIKGVLLLDCSRISANIVDGFENCVNDLMEYGQVSYQDSADMATLLLIIVIVVLVIAVAIAVFLTIYISGLIAKPLSIIAGAFSQIGTRGKLSFDAATTNFANETSLRKDELGDCAKGFTGIITHLQEIEKNLAEIAGGDLTTEVHALSEDDSIANSMQRTLDNLNTMFGEINSASNQVSTGSKQIADGAQSLAQGSTEQAASVQELSASIGEIAQKTKENATMAERAATLAGTIMQNAEKGSTQMGDMTTAVQEINQASQSISKVIKVIDDIAFQTNILALNAAVEAARAGQHGKGFAVVAEEVRNLAAKSAEAAKDTGGLIQNSMEKAELGARIAGETAESLADIVAGINESSQIVDEIARSSEEQSLGISQINTGIDQVAQVVQQNSATAEESAAASEQMSSQSSMLEGLIAQFKLKNQNYGSQILQSKSKPVESLPAATYEDVYEPQGSSDFGKY
ncbi:MAG: methyl-accepting chemotaxis protein [Oscillospiraceae bacterium]|jgi:methyl-accepting chemotaxis protein|nr:methyl-accepting chemotaxis protein [Oscillospiraceae bacterium]